MRNLRSALLLATGVVAVATILAAPRLQAQSRQAPVLAITNATVLTVTKGTLTRGTVIVKDGRIAAVGADIAVPSGAEVVDATGRFVTPGIIDAHSHIAADSVNEGGTTVSSMTGIEDVFNPTDINIYRDLAGGVTTANVLHGSANPIGGRNLVIKLRWGKVQTDEFRFAGALPGIKFALGENPKDMRQFGQEGPRRYPTSRMGVEFVIRDAFTRARKYQAEWAAYAARKQKDAAAVPPRRDLQLEPLVEVLEGKRLVHAHCYRADEILMLLRLAEEVGFRIATLQHVLEGYKVAREIAAHGAGASTFSDWWGYKVEASGATPWNAALMTRKGVLVSINSDSAEHSRRLNTEAAKSIKWGGLSDDEALALVTVNPARQLRVAERVGSIEPGKDADLVVWNRHPLSSYAVADRVYIDGTLYYDRSKEDARVADLASRKAALVQAEKDAAARDKKDDKKDDSKPETPEVPPTTSATDGHHAAGGTNGHPGNLKQQANPKLPDNLTAIVNARIHPITSASIERGTIVLRAGRIEALGATVAVPSGAQVIDAAGADVYPGFIDPSTALGLDEPGPRGFADTAESVEYNPHLRTRTAYHPDSEAIPVARANGVTTVGVVPGGGVLSGELAVMQLDGWTWEEATLRASAGIAFQFPPISRPRRFGAPAEGQVVRRLEEGTGPHARHARRPAGTGPRVRAHASDRTPRRLGAGGPGAHCRRRAAAGRHGQPRGRHPRRRRLWRARARPIGGRRRRRGAARRGALEREAGAGHPRASPAAARTGRRPPRGDIQGGCGPGRGRRVLRAQRRQRRDQCAAAPIPGVPIGGVGTSARPCAFGHHHRRGAGSSASMPKSAASSRASAPTCSSRTATRSRPARRSPTSSSTAETWAWTTCTSGCTKSTQPDRRRVGSGLAWLGRSGLGLVRSGWVRFGRVGSG